MTATFSLTAATGIMTQPLADDPFKVSGYRLDNGATVCFSPDMSTNDVFVAVMFRTGAMDDPADKTGLAHYLEHLLFKGSEKLGTADYAAEKPLLDRIGQLYREREKTTDAAERDRLYREIDAVSAEAAGFAVPNDYAAVMMRLGVSGTNAFTGYHLTCYIDNVPAAALPAYFTVAADRFAHPVFRGFHTELETVYEERNMSLDNPSRVYEEFLLAALAGGHPLGRPVAGTPEDLRNPSPDRVMEFYRKYYTTGNMTVILAGAVQPEKVLPMLEETIGKLPAAPRVAVKYPPLPAFERPETRRITLPLPAKIDRIWRLPNLTDREKDTAALLAVALGNDTIGVLARDYVMPGRLAAASVDFEEMPDDINIFSCSLTPAAGESPEAAGRLLDESLEAVRDGNFPDWLPEAAANQTRLSLLRSAEMPSSAALSVAFNLANGEQWETAIGRLAAIKTITAAEIAAFAKKYLTENNLTVILDSGSRAPAEKFTSPAMTALQYPDGAESKLNREIAAMNIKDEEVPPPDLDRDAPTTFIEPVPGRKIPVRTVKNPRTDDYFTVEIVFQNNYLTDRLLPFAAACFDLSGSGDRSGDDMALELYRLGGNVTLTSDRRTVLTVSGLSENFDRIIELAISKLAAPSITAETIAREANLTAEIRRNAMENPRDVFDALVNYALFDRRSPDIDKTPSDELAAVSTERVQTALSSLWRSPFRVYLHGNTPAERLEKLFPKVDETSGAAPELRYSPPTGRRVWLCRVPGVKQTHLGFLRRGPVFDPATFGSRAWLQEYYGGSMNSVVFRELREKKSLGYNPFAVLRTPSPPLTEQLFMLKISTQSDKTADALDAIDNLGFPVDPERMRESRESMLRSMRTERFAGSKLINLAETYDEMALPHDYRAQSIALVENASADDIGRYFERYCTPFEEIVAVGADLNQELFAKFGPVTELAPEQIMAR
ncbi:MAG: insulinase family protein [Victivallaceae bacterium]|nr:insulinase family protein [Victivallaceae bacterium]